MAIKLVLSTLVFFGSLVALWLIYLSVVNPGYQPQLFAKTQDTFRSSKYVYKENPYPAELTFRLAKKANYRKCIELPQGFYEFSGCDAFYARHTSRGDNEQSIDRCDPLVQDAPLFSLDTDELKSLAEDVNLIGEDRHYAYPIYNVISGTEEQKQLQVLSIGSTFQINSTLQKLCLSSNRSRSWGLDALESQYTVRISRIE